MECLVPLNKIWPAPTMADSEPIVVQTVITGNSNHQFGVLSTTHVTDNLEKRLRLSASIGQATTRIQTMTRA